MRVLAAISGGVDSAVAAARAVDGGHDVVGVHMALSHARAEPRDGARGCGSVENVRDARTVADALGIPFQVWDLSERFEQAVVADFLSEYSGGRTPNPCVRCNEHVKFAALLDRALALGFDAVCTGHYARVAWASDGTCTLLRARDRAKDQSYVVAAAGPDRLARAMFPIGEAASKDEVRGEAARRGLAVAGKPDSYDICFIADGDTRGFLRARLGSRPGVVVDADGAVVGEHDGAFAFTIGQRRGLHLDRPAADGRPRYVIDVRPATNTVVVGPAEMLAVAGLRGTGAVWFGGPPTDGAACAVQVRAHGDALPCRVWAARDGAVEVAMDGGLRGLASGQTAVLYDGDRVLGQATVAEVLR
jgi:tRNA-uridine 2-sulfurtransferase